MHRQAVYQGLLKAIGGYFYYDAHDGEWGEMITAFDDEPYKPILDWIGEGKEPVVNAFHLWGVGNGQIGGHFAYDYMKDRRVEWDSDREVWLVTTSEKYVVTGYDSVPGAVRKGPAWPSEPQRIISV